MSSSPAAGRSQRRPAVMQTIPIVMSASAFDPVQAGWAEGYARPGRNVTGLTFATDEAVEKQLELLKKVAPHVRHVDLLRSRQTRRSAGHPAHEVRARHQSQHREGARP